MNEIRHTLLGLTVVLLAACSTTKQKAPVVDTSAPAAKKAPAAVKKAAPDRPGYYTVRPGDTLGKIARRFGQRTENLAAWNRLANKNDIKVGQELRLKAPDDAAQTAAVSGSAVEVRPLGGDSSGKATEGQQQTAAAAPSADSSTAPKEEEGVAWIWPADGRIVATFQEGKSKGIDIAGSPGQKVVAAADGKVLFASAIRGYGNLVIIKHNDSLVSAYAHNRAILVKEGATVTKGQQIAEMGKSDSDIVKLHLEIRRQGRPVDPLRYLPAR